jgi:integrase
MWRSYFCVSQGLRHRNPYQTRHTFASLMLDQDEDPAWVARMLGHTMLRMLYERHGKFIRNRTRHDGEQFPQGTPRRSSTAEGR